MKVRALSLSVLSLAAMTTAAVAQPAAKKVKVERACGVAALPLSVGNSWTYEPVVPPEDRIIPEAGQRFMPWPPKKLTIKVTAIDTKDGVTTVSLTEDLDGRVHPTSITCKAGGADFRIAPDSFWFAGEPGTTFGIELTEVTRTGHTLELAGGKISAAALEWQDDFTAKWKHVPTAKSTPPMRTGTITVGRHFVPQPPEQVATKAGAWKAFKVGVEITNLVTIDPAPALPLKDIPLQVNFLFQADNVGIVQAINSFGQAFVLTEFTVQ